MDTKDTQYSSLDAPSVEQLQEWFMDGICEATDGCNSWLIELGLI